MCCRLAKPTISAPLACRIALNSSARLIPKSLHKPSDSRFILAVISTNVNHKKATGAEVEDAIQKVKRLPGPDNPNSGGTTAARHRAINTNRSNEFTNLPQWLADNFAHENAHEKDNAQESSSLNGRNGWKLSHSVSLSYDYVSS
jgi:hypothetical protein